LDADKPAWQRSVALEVLHRLVVEPGLLAAFCACYDLKVHSTKIFRDIIDSLASYVQSLFNPSMVVSGSGSMNNASMIGLYFIECFALCCFFFFFFFLNQQYYY
jgi:hypothetical protein